MDMFTPQCASLPAKICLGCSFFFLNSSKLVVTTHHLQRIVARCGGTLQVCKGRRVAGEYSPATRRHTIIAALSQVGQHLDHITASSNGQRSRLIACCCSLIAIPSFA